MVVRQRSGVLTRDQCTELVVHQGETEVALAVQDRARQVESTMNRLAEVAWSSSDFWNRMIV